jgi:hypothetical protein
MGHLLAFIRERERERERERRSTELDSERVG